MRNACMGLSFYNTCLPSVIILMSLLLNVLVLDCRGARGL